VWCDWWTPNSGREYASLEDPNQDRSAVSFTSDGARLVTTNRSGTNSVHVWDLRAIRVELSKLDLDWDLPAYDPPSRTDDRKPLEVRIDTGDPSQIKPDRREIARQEIERVRRSVETNPNDPNTCNDLAWK
jgi:hypothetical protein